MGGPTKTVFEVNEGKRNQFKTRENTYDMFPVGSRVRVICIHQDFTFFKGTETGTVVKNNKSYLGIHVKFDHATSIEGFSFEPKDLILISEGELGLKTTEKSKLNDCTLQGVLVDIEHVAQNLGLYGLANDQNVLKDAIERLKKQQSV